MVPYLNPVLRLRTVSLDRVECLVTFAVLSGGELANITMYLNLNRLDINDNAIYLWGAIMLIS